MMTECRHSILGNPHAHVDDAREYRLGKLPEDVDFATSDGFTFSYRVALFEFCDIQARQPILLVLLSSYATLSTLHPILCKCEWQ